MKKLVEIIEDNGEGLDSLMGEQVIVFCVNYIYAGKLIGINKDDILLENGQIVYETGAFTDTKYKDAQEVADKLYIRTSAIESYAKGK